jgi:hypothetical protein
MLIDIIRMGHRVERGTVCDFRHLLYLLGVVVFLSILFRLMIKKVVGTHVVGYGLLEQRWKSLGFKVHFGERGKGQVMSHLFKPFHI